MFKSDLEIALESKILHINEIAKQLNVDINELEHYGKYKAKLPLKLLDIEKEDGKLILVTAISPTPAGEGKSTTTVGLGQALNILNQKCIIALREPSFGPVMGIKGGAAGGGYAQVLPMEDINLHFTGDIHAITTANNAISSFIDNHIHQGNELNFDSRKITWKRCLDLNDRALRQVTVGLGGPINGFPRTDGFNITVASEIMAILCLAVSMEDLKARIEAIVIATSIDGSDITVLQLGIAGAIVMILKDAIKPNLVQTTENTPVLIHGGPFANIAHGCNSLIATKMALKLADITVTEAGFGADLGAEKFFDIKSRIGDLKPSVVVIVATIRALKMHGGVAKQNLKEENVDALIKGIANLEKHIDTVEQFNVPYVVCINEFITDTKDEINTLLNYIEAKNIPVAISQVWEKGGKGGIDLGNKVLELIKEENDFKPLYELNASIEEKLNIIATKVYGAEKVEYSSKALKQIKEYSSKGWDELPICVAKTPNSLSDDPTKYGRPVGFTITINEFRPSIGAGFIVAMAGDVMTMPGLPKKPSALQMGVTTDGIVQGLF